MDYETVRYMQTYRKQGFSTAQRQALGITTIEELFWAYVNKNGECWIWEGPPWGEKGYGGFWWEGKRYRAHVFAWELENGIGVPEDREICHRCNNRGCVRPSHVYAGTDRDNAQDRVRAGQAATAKPRTGDAQPLVFANGFIENKFQELALRVPKRGKRINGYTNGTKIARNP